MSEKYTAEQQAYIDSLVKIRDRFQCKCEEVVELHRAAIKKCDKMRREKDSLENEIDRLNTQINYIKVFCVIEE